MCYAHQFLRNCPSTERLVDISKFNKSARALQAHVGSATSGLLGMDFTAVVSSAKSPIPRRIRLMWTSSAFWPRLLRFTSRRRAMISHREGGRVQRRGGWGPAIKLTSICGVSGMDSTTVVNSAQLPIPRRIRLMWTTYPHSERDY